MNPWRPRPTTRSVPMPSLPRIKRSPRRARVPEVVVATPEPRLAELHDGNLTWVHLDAPHGGGGRAAPARFGWHPLDLEDVLSKRQRPKIDEYPEYLFGVLHFPVYDKTVQRLNAGELDFFLGPEFLVTLPTVELLPVTRLFQRCYGGRRAAREPVRQGLRATCSTTFSTTCSTTASRSSTRSGTSSTRSRTRCSRAARRRSSATSPTSSRRSSPTARSSSPSGRPCACSSATTRRFLPEELEVYFDDIVDASERIWDLLDNYKEVVEGLESTNESVISHRQNDILRILTVFSVVLLPLTLLTGIFGMNVRFPGFDTPRTGGPSSARWSSSSSGCSASSGTRSSSEKHGHGVSFLACRAELGPLRSSERWQIRARLVSFKIQPRKYVKR